MAEQHIENYRDGTPTRRPRHELLQQYYTKVSGASKQPDAALDINGSGFQASSYLEKIIKEMSLSDLLQHETEVVQQIRHLDSEMQTLVYENYNKFINATDTIRKMKTDFLRMEREMSELSDQMISLTSFSTRISDTLHERRSRISQLAGVHALLKKLQFLFELPAKLRECIENKFYSQAVRYFVRAESVLQQYEELPSFRAIQADCLSCVAELKQQLRAQFTDQQSSAKQLAESVDLLLQLNEPAQTLCAEFLKHSRERLNSDLSSLERLIPADTGSSESTEPDIPDPKPPASIVDVLDFVDRSCNTFLSNLCLVIASYTEMFLGRAGVGISLEEEASVQRALVQFVHELIQSYFTLVERRVQCELEGGDNTLLVRALDRFHRRLQAMSKLLPDTDFSRAGMEIVSTAAKGRAEHYLAFLKQHFADLVTDIRQQLAAPRGTPRLAPPTKDVISGELHQLLSQTQHSLLEQTRAVLVNLQAFIGADVTFAMKPYFRHPFCNQHVRDGVLVAYVQHITSMSAEFCAEGGSRASVPPTLLLILSRLCADLESSTIAHLMSLCDEQFDAPNDETAQTQTVALCAQMKQSSTSLINHYVRVQGLAISQMLRKSVESRDWLSCLEPRTVRAVMKRVVEDVTTVDSQVGQLLEEGTKRERSSDSSRRTGLAPGARAAQRGQWQFSGPGSVDAGLVSNIHRLFAEKIEIFAEVEFNKVSVLTGIVKIALKTLLECVRLRTFGRYGVQQLQVDCYYLQLYLWRFVNDENLVHVMLDEILSSAMNRSLDPTLMEQSVVELICERG